MSEPTTEAGKRFVGDVASIDSFGYSIQVSVEYARQEVAVIEAQARADLARRIEARVVGLPDENTDTLVPNTGPRLVDPAAALAAIREEADRD